MQLIELLQLKGCVVTADALHCHRAMAKAIVERGGDYVLAVKGNQPVLLADAKAAIACRERTSARRPVTTARRRSWPQARRRAALVAPVKDMAAEARLPGP